MQKLISLALALVMLLWTFSVAPLAAEGEVEIEDYAIFLDDGIHLLFEFTGGEYVYVPVAAKEMGDLKAPDGFEAVYSVRDYAADILSDPNKEAQTKSLVFAMLSYGAAAQKYFDYNSEDLVGTPVSDIETLEGVVAPAITVSDEASIYIGATLILEATLTLRFYFKGTDASLTVNGEEVEVRLGNGYCYVDVSVMPYEMSSSVTVSCGDTEVTYAPINYLKNMLDSENEDFVSLLASIYAYGRAAEDYRVANCDQHGITLANIISERVPTAHYSGNKIGVCSACGVIATQNIPETGKIEVIKPTGFVEHCYSTSIDGLLSEGDEMHFYPTPDDPDGKSLYVEYSMLFNETLSKTDETGWITSPFFSKTTNFSRDPYEAVILHPNNKACCPAGALDIQLDNGDDDFNDENITYYENDVVVVKYDQKRNKSFYVINDLYGWHRIGYEITQAYEVSGASIEYKLYMNIYVDGVLVLRVDFSDDIDRMCYLYKLYVEDGEPVFKDANQGRSVTAIVLDGLASSSENVCLPIADVYVTCGNGFVFPVAPVEDPTENSLVVDGETLDARVFFTPVN